MDVVVHSLPDCKYCTLTKEFLTQQKVPFDTIMYDKAAPDYPERKDALVSRTGMTTFPQIYIGDAFIGGYMDLIKAYESLRFHDLCRKVGIEIPYDF